MAKSSKSMVAVILLTVGVSPAAGSGTAGVRAGVSTACEDPAKGKKYDDQALSLLVFASDAVDPQNVVCSFSAKNTNARNSNNGQKGVKGRVTGSLLNAAGAEIGSWNATFKTNAAGYASKDFDPRLVPGDFSALALDVDLFGAKKLNQFDVSCSISGAPSCMTGAQNACLLNGRFKVEVDIGGTTGERFKSNNTEATFFVGNTDVIVQMLQRCSENDHFWFFASATRNAPFDLTVTDTATGEVRQYDNDLGNPLDPIVDTAAFATCP